MRIKIIFALILINCLLLDNIYAGGLTRGRILFDSLGLKKKGTEADRPPSIEPGTALDDASEGAVLMNYEFWDADGKRHVGTYVPVSPNFVLNNTAFGPNSSVLGLYKPVSISNVRQGISFGPSGSISGILVLPSTNSVLSGVTYGAGGLEFTGTYVVAGNDPGTTTNDANAGSVLTNREFWSQSGTRRSGRYFPVSISNVKAGITFGSNNVKTGVFTSDANVSKRDIRLGKVSYSNGVKVIGTLTNRSSFIGPDGTRVIFISNGIFEGKTITAFDSDLTTWNIRKDINMFGTNGSFVGSPLRTGQVSIYAARDDGAMRMGWHDIYTNANSSWNGATRFSNGGNVVLDRLTGLMWAQNGRLGGGYFDWITSVNNCNSLNLGGYTDWRMPNILELESLIDRNNNTPALPTGHPFQNVRTNYWSSTTISGTTTEAWVHGMANGKILDYDKTLTMPNLCYWPIRGGR